MSFQAQTWAIRVRVGDPVLKLLLLTLANYANEDGECWHSQKRIAHDTEIPERTLRRKIAALGGMGLIEVTARTREDGTKTTSLIRLLADSKPAATVASGSSTGQNGGAPEAKTGGQPAANMVAGQDSSMNRKELTIERVTRGREAERFFDEIFWPEYPKRDGNNPKEPARKKIIAAVMSGENPDDILAGVRRLAHGHRVRNEIGSRFVPQAVTWINGKGWRDDPVAPPAPAPARTGYNQPSSGGFFEAAAALRRNLGE